MVNITEEKRDGILYTNIALTRGDDVTLEMPIFVVNSSGEKTEYTPINTDSFLIQVRRDKVKDSDTIPTLVFEGNTSIENEKLHWYISHVQSTQNCRKYYWDCQITKDNKTYTIYQGYLTILPESSIAEE